VSASDAHAAAASVASLEAGGRVSRELASLALLLALSTNTLTKVVLAFASGTRRFAWAVAIGLLLVLTSAWAGYVLALLG